MQTISAGPGILPGATPPLPAVVRDGFDAALSAQGQAFGTAPPPVPPPSLALGKLAGETQKLIDIGNAIDRTGPGLTTASLSLGTGGLGAGAPIVDLSGLNRAYDFAMRSYLLSKVASEVSGGLRSLWQAQ
jgi:hypothetical protein